ncbi:LITAF-like zinc ribbon domain-containing protein [Microdochium trichocladiopsis]|uniref:LITAF-like zinc ribbon domain-containing protein n=1 Tax=Microdochium trichocladiopsis TaxID=1682393 RepID=A0A9P9BSB6_9PEZI|nr:LITAF-like zinc ribbon domain-containing protein [Microdochium trichocladiopsis]KAH7028165.1 LITAF-like zinc ribbon domain-containing protein [Microdochium trichocladiopsis]
MPIKRKDMTSYTKANFDTMSVETRSGEVQAPTIHNATTGPPPPLIDVVSSPIHQSHAGSIHTPPSHHSYHGGNVGASQQLPFQAPAYCSTTIHHHNMHASATGTPAVHHHTHSQMPVNHYYAEPPRLYGNVVPVPLLQRFPALIQCPACRDIGPTSVRHVPGKGTHWMATFFFFTTGLGVFIPYAANHFKNAEHMCSKCGRIVAVQRFGGATQAKLL